MSCSGNATNGSCVANTGYYLTRVTHVNGSFPAVYMSCTGQNFRSFLVSNLSVRNFRICLLMYPRPLTLGRSADRRRPPSGRRTASSTALTTNGILLMHPQGAFCGGRGRPGAWMEVSVGGGMYGLRATRSAAQKGLKVRLSGTGISPAAALTDAVVSV